MVKPISQSFTRATAMLHPANLAALQYALSNRAAFVFEFDEGEIVNSKPPDSTRPTLQRIIQILDPDEEQLYVVVMSKIGALMGLVSMCSMVTLTEEQNLPDQAKKMLEGVEGLVKSLNSLDGETVAGTRMSSGAVPPNRTLH